MSGIPGQAPDIGVQDVTPDSALIQHQQAMASPAPMPVAQPPMQGADMPTPSVYPAERPGFQAQAQTASFNPIGTAPPTPQELAAVGYQAPPTQQELAAVGYQRPPSTPEEAKGQQMEQHGNALLDMIQAAGNQVGSLASGVVKNVGKFIGSDTVEKLGDLNERVSDKLVNQATTSSPILGNVGKYAADAGAALLATPAASSIPGLLASGAVGGAASALATSNAADPSKDILQGAALGGATGGVLGTLSSVLKPVLAGTRLWASNTGEIVDNTLQAAIDKTGKTDVSQITPAAFLKSAQDIQNTAKDTANALYQARDAYANQIGATVNRSGLSDFKDVVGHMLSSGSTDVQDATFKAAQKALGDGSPIDFTQAQNLVSNLGKDASTASASGDSAKAAGILQVKGMLEGDIQKSVNDPNLATLHGAAQSYYKNVVAPINNLQLDKQLADKYTQDTFVAKLANKVLDTPNAMQAMGQVNPAIRDQAIAGTMNALRASASTDGTLNLSKFATSIQKEVGQNSGAYGDAANNLSAYAKILAAKAGSDQNAPKSLMMKMGMVGAGIGGFLVGGLHGAAATVALDKGYFLHSAGKMLEDDGVQDLLHTANNLMNTGKNPGMLDKISDYIIDATHKVLPPDTSPINRIISTTGAGVLNQNISS